MKIAEIRNLNDFIKRFAERFPYSFKDGVRGRAYILWSEEAVKYLWKPGVDYQKLYKIAITENPEQNEGFAPSLSWLKSQLSRCYRKNTSDPIYLHVKIFDPRSKIVKDTDCFPIGTDESQIIDFYEKKFNCKGWQVVETYRK